MQRKQKKDTLTTALPLQNQNLPSRFALGLTYPPKKLCYWPSLCTYFQSGVMGHESHHSQLIELINKNIKAIHTYLHFSFLTSHVDMPL